MRLFEAIIDANRRRVAGDRNACVDLTSQAASLPVAALTCIDARLNHLLPGMLGLPEDRFIWLRNAGNIITGPLSSTMRSLALACAVKGGKEIAIIGHNECLIGKTTMLQLLDRLGALGVDRHRLPENLVEYFGLFGSERQNVIRGVEFIRGSPLVGAAIPVHGLLIDIKTGELEWVVNGYDAAPAAASGKVGDFLSQAENSLNQLAQIGAAAEELKLPVSRIGEVVSVAQDWLHKVEHVVAAVQPASSSSPPAPAGTPPPLEPSKQNPLATLQERMRRFSAKNPARAPRRS